ncbi:MAG: hypothetical protein L0K86_10885 [Actinomycetia bacterium]|nr:hypothetical protein [Actinomycetes bacterium]
MCEQLLDGGIPLGEKVDVVADVVAQSQLALGLEAHHDRRRHRLGHRADQELAVRGDFPTVAVVAMQVLVLDTVWPDHGRRHTGYVVLLRVRVQVRIDLVESVPLGSLCRHRPQSHESDRHGDHARRQERTSHSNPPKPYGHIVMKNSMYIWFW